VNVFFVLLTSVSAGQLASPPPAIPSVPPVAAAVVPGAALAAPAAKIATGVFSKSSCGGGNGSSCGGGCGAVSDGCAIECGCEKPKHKLFGFLHRNKKSSCEPACETSCTPACSAPACEPACAAPAKKHGCFGKSASACTTSDACGCEPTCEKPRKKLFGFLHRNKNECCEVITNSCGTGCNNCEPAAAAPIAAPAGAPAIIAPAAPTSNALPAGNAIPGKVIEPIKKMPAEGNKGVLLQPTSGKIEAEGNNPF